MARRLNETAREAVEAAQKAQTDNRQYKAATAEKIDALISSIDAEKKRSDRKVSSGISDIKTELLNFKQLVAGQLQSSAKQSDQAVPQQPASGWTKIGPVNILPETYNGPRTGVASLDVRSNESYSINDGFLLSGTKEGSNGEPNFITPVATIPENSPLLHSVTLSTLIGRVPKQGNVFEPFNFFIQTGSENWTSQDHQIPFLERAIWRGVATGDKDLRCIRGSLTSVTFVFSDETIQTVSGTRDKPLAELVTTTGSNCIPGQYVSNTRKYLAAYGFGGALAGLGEGIAGNETLTSLTEGGRIISAVNGNTGNFLAGRALSSSANKAAEIIDDEYESSFASVVLQAGVDVNMIALEQINIDHDAAGRKVTYLDPSYQ
jgi:integrating conjugative element protein (TIGR03752 family)